MKGPCWHSQLTAIAFLTYPEPALALSVWPGFLEHMVGPGYHDGHVTLEIGMPGMEDREWPATHKDPVSTGG